MESAGRQPLGLEALRGSKWDQDHVPESCAPRGGEGWGQGRTRQSAPEGSCDSSPAVSQAVAVSRRNRSRSSSLVKRVAAAPPPAPSPPSIAAASSPFISCRWKIFSSMAPAARCWSPIHLIQGILASHYIMRTLAGLQGWGLDCLENDQEHRAQVGCSTPQDGPTLLNPGSSVVTQAPCCWTRANPQVLCANVEAGRGPRLW